MLEWIGLKTIARSTSKRASEQDLVFEIIWKSCSLDERARLEFCKYCSLARLLVERASNRFQHPKPPPKHYGSFSAQIRNMTNPGIWQTIGCWPRCGVVDGSVVPCKLFWRPFIKIRYTSPWSWVYANCFGALS